MRFSFVGVCFPLLRPHCVPPRLTIIHFSRPPPRPTPLSPLPRPQHETASSRLLRWPSRLLGQPVSSLPSSSSTPSSPSARVFCHLLDGQVKGVHHPDPVVQTCHHIPPPPTPLFNQPHTRGRESRPPRFRRSSVKMSRQILHLPLDRGGGGGNCVSVSASTRWGWGEGGVSVSASMLAPGTYVVRAQRTAPPSPASWRTPCTTSCGHRAGTRTVSVGV